MHIIPAAPAAAGGVQGMAASGPMSGQAGTFESVLAANFQSVRDRALLPQETDAQQPLFDAAPGRLAGRLWAALYPPAAQDEALAQTEAETETEAELDENLAAALAAMAQPIQPQPAAEEAADAQPETDPIIDPLDPAQPPVIDILEGSLQPPASQYAPEPGADNAGERVARMPQQPTTGEPTRASIATDGDSCPLENTDDPTGPDMAAQTAAVQAKIQAEAETETPPDAGHAAAQDRDLPADAGQTTAPAAPAAPDAQAKTAETHEAFEMADASEIPETAETAETATETGPKIQPEGEADRPAGRMTADKPAAEAPVQAEAASRAETAESDSKSFGQGDEPEQESAGQKPAAKAETAPSADFSDAGVSRPLDLGALRVQGEMQMQPRPVVTATQQTLMDTMVEQISVHRQADSHQVEIELRPDYLGKVSIQLTLDGNGLQAKIRAEDPTVRGLIGGQINQLIESLEQKGVRLTEVDMTYQTAQSQDFGQSGGGREQMNQEGRNRPMTAQAIAKGARRGTEPEFETLTRDTYVATGADPYGPESMAAGGYRA